MAESTSSIYQLHIALREIEPQVWRRVAVPSDLTLAKLHRTIQVVMGWKDSHLHEFIVEGLRYGQPSPEWDSPDLLSERGIRLGALRLKPGSTFTYVYDFGDDWQHDVRLEKVLGADRGPGHSRCLAGARQCPPEDCGGVPGYEELLKTVRHPDDAEHADLLEWLGGDFDPEAFDLNGVNRRLRRLR